MLHDIYASVERSAKLKGWDGVDLVIIGGDFQASLTPYLLRGHPPNAVFRLCATLMT